jgi:uncharacterized Zn finger protein
MSAHPLSKENLTFLLGLADHKTSQRGYSYFHSGAVTQLRITGTSARAVVDGTEPYKVRVDYDGTEPAFSCSCPVGMRGEFCKHAVAVVFAWNDSSAQVEPEADILSIQLLQLSTDELVKIITSQCETDQIFERRLKIRLSKQPSSPAIDVRSVKEFLKRSFTARDFVDYRAARGFALKMEEGLSMLEETLEAGHAAQCLELAEFTMRLADKACLSMDDSDGHMTPIFERIEEIHRIACERSAPDPIKLAQDLFKLVTEASFCQFWDCLDTLKAQLGSDGRSHFQSLIQAGWEKIPTRRPTPIADRYSHRLDYDHDEEKTLHRSAITHFMKLFAEESGDVDARVAVLERDLRYAHDVAQICRLYREAGRFDEALKWSLEGLKMFPDRFDRRLVEEALQSYVALNCVDEAIDLAWNNWSKSPGVENYKILRDTSQLKNAWQSWRTRAHQVMREQIASETARTKNSKKSAPWWVSPGYGASSNLVAVFLWEKNLEEAWNIAQEHGCSEDQLRTLARSREEVAPLDVVPIYQNFVASGLLRRDPTRYSTIAEEVEHIGRLLVKAGELNLFVTYHAELRTEYKRLRNFMKALDERRGISDMIEK